MKTVPAVLSSLAPGFLHRACSRRQIELAVSYVTSTTHDTNDTRSEFPCSLSSLHIAINSLPLYSAA